MAHDPPLVTVVTPVLNGARTLAATLQSVRAQTHSRVEHIVVDGGSTDDTAAIVAGFRGIAFWSAPDRGMYDALNQGYARGRGDVLTSLNADDRYASPDALAAAVDALDAHPDADVVYGDYRYVDDDGGVLETVRSPAFDLRLLARANVVPPHAAFVRRRVFHERGLQLDPSLRFAGDWEWFLRMARAGVGFRHVPVVFADFRRHGGSLTSTVGWRAKLSEWRRICRRHDVSFARLLLHELALGPRERRRRSRAAAS